MNNHIVYLGGLHTRIRLLETPVHFIAGTQQVFAEWIKKLINEWRATREILFSYSQPRSAFLMLWHTCVFAGPDWSCQSNSSSQFLPWWLKMLPKTGQVKSYLQAKFICKHVQSLLKGLYIKMATWRHPTYSLPPHFSLQVYFRND